MAIFIVLTPFVINHLGTQQYGLLVLVLTFSVFSGSLSIFDPGIQGATEKYIAEYNAKADKGLLYEVIGTSYFFYLILGLIAATSFILTTRLFLLDIFNIPLEIRAIGAMLFYIMGAQILIEFLCMPVRAIIEGLQRFNYSNFAIVSGSLLSAILTIIMLSERQSVVLVGVANLIGSLLVLFLMIIFCKQLLPGFRLRDVRFHPERFKEMLRLGLKLVGFRINGIIYYQIDKYVIPLFLSLSSLSYYAIAIKPMVLVDLFQGSISSIIMPVASEMSAKNDHNKMREVFLLACKYSVAITLSVAIFTMLFSREILSFWIGPQYGRLSYLAQLVILPVILTSPIVVGMNMMVGADRAGVVLKINTVATYLKVILTPLMAWQYNLLGVALATMISMLISGLMYLTVYLRYFAVSLIDFVRATIFPGVLAALVSGLLISMVNLMFYKPRNLFEIGIALSIGFCCYWISFILIIPNNERNYLFALFRGRMLKLNAARIKATEKTWPTSAEL